MKKVMIIVILLVCIAGAIFFSIRNSAAENVANAKDNVMLAQRDLDKANIAYLSEMETYRQEAAAKIETNRRNLAAFNARIEAAKAETRADYKKKISELERMNTDMKKRVEDYKANGKDNWDKFKIEFSRDMEKLGNAFKDLMVSNVE